MTILDSINADLKTALLSHNKQDATVLRGLKSVILNQEIAQNKRDSGLGDGDVLKLLSSEVKKLRESADIYAKAGESERAAKDLAEIETINKYLPEPLSEDDLISTVDQVMSDMGDNATAQNMGVIIGTVRSKAGPTADGAAIARLVKERLQK